MVLARELGRRLGLQVALVTYLTGAAVVPALDHDAWDVGFRAIEPERAERVIFTGAYMFIDGTYLVREDAPFWPVVALYVEGVQIAVVGAPHTTGRSLANSVWRPSSQRRRRTPP